MDTWRRSELGEAPKGWVHLYDLHPVGRDAQWVLVRSYGERKDGEPRLIPLSENPGDLGWGTLLQIALPWEQVRRHVVRDEKAPPGTYRVPAAIINGYGRIRIVRTGPDMPGEPRREAPLESDVSKVLADLDAEWLDSLYEAFRQSLPVHADRVRPCPMHCRLVLLASRRALTAALKALPPPEEIERRRCADDEGVGDDDAGDEENDYSDDDADGDEIDWSAVDRRNLYARALSLLNRPRSPAAWGVVRHALERLADTGADDATARLRAFVHLFGCAVAESHGGREPVVAPVARPSCSG